LQSDGAGHACSSVGDCWSDRSHGNVRGGVSFPGRIGLEGGRRRVVPRPGRSGLRPRLSLGCPTPQSLWCMGSGALRKEYSYVSETLAAPSTRYIRSREIHPPRPNSLRRSLITWSRERVCQRRRRPIGAFSISGATFTATKTGPGLPRMSGRAAENGSSS
jgi:hypothetical protein